jgi:hypothetical protein
VLLPEIILISISNIRYMKWLFVSFLFVSSIVSAQRWKSYRITSKKDTINCVDYNDLKQGRWSVKVDGLRGEPGYEEEGIYKDGKKEGIWRAYTTMGDLYSVESYRGGNKDGKSQYYSLSGLVREESWKAVNPENPYDTVDVYNPVDQNKVQKKVVKVEASSVKHGTWTFFEPGSGMIVKTERYFLGKIDDPFQNTASVNADNANKKETKPKEKVKPKEVLDFEKKIGKRKVKVIDL